MSAIKKTPQKQTKPKTLKPLIVTEEDVSPKKQTTMETFIGITKKDELADSSSDEYDDIEEFEDTEEVDGEEVAIEEIEEIEDFEEEYEQLDFGEYDDTDSQDIVEIIQLTDEAASSTKTTSSSSSSSSSKTTTSTSKFSTVSGKLSNKLAPPKQNASLALKRIQQKAVEQSTKTTEVQKKSEQSNVEPLASQRRNRLTEDNLSSEQMMVINEVAKGNSCFVTGGGGVGKSALIDILRKMLYNAERKTAVTSTTGISSLLVRGMTFNSWAGVGLSDGRDESTLEKFKKNRVKDKILKRWREVDTLIIDEVSVLSPYLFDMASHIASLLRKNNNYFGGIQVIAFGDFLQLPPIFNGIAKPFLTFAFQSDIWKSMFPASRSFYLRTIYRQDNMEFKMYLERIRNGELRAKDMPYFKQFFTEHNAADSDAVMLFARNDDVEEYNSKKLDQLDAPSISFQAYDEGDSEYVGLLKDSCLAPTVLQLKKGALVMLLKNLDTFQGLVNGLVGTVIGFVRIEADEFNKNTFIRYDRRGLIHYQDYSNEYDVRYRVRPVVTFRKTWYILDASTWEFTEGSMVLATRCQIPLRLCWAITVHKSQGQALDKVQICMRNFFANGQAYVAFSRVKDPAGLKICHFKHEAFKAHPQAAAYYKDLEDTSPISIAAADADSSSSNCSASSSSSSSSSRKRTTTSSTSLVVSPYFPNPKRARE